MFVRYQYVVAFGSLASGAIYTVSELWRRTFLPHKQLSCGCLILMAVGFWLWGEAEWPWLLFAGFVAGLLFDKLRRHLESEHSIEMEVAEAQREARQLRPKKSKHKAA
jgi:hypothetical protein